MLCPYRRVPPMENKSKVNMDAAAIVCREVAVDNAPILYAVRSEPEDVADSGWQFLCGRGNEDPAFAQVWALHEVLDRDQSLRPFFGLPFGTILERSSANARWKILNP
jgi:hypothetical protein